jgi:hypothetical protein
MAHVAYGAVVGASQGIALALLEERELVLVCQVFTDLILRRPPFWAAVSKDGRGRTEEVAILRDGRAKRAASSG